MDRAVHFNFNRKEFSFVLDSGYIAFEIGENFYGGMWFTWLGIEFAFATEMIDLKTLGK